MVSVALAAALGFIAGVLAVGACVGLRRAPSLARALRDRSRVAPSDSDAPPPLAGAVDAGGGADDHTWAARAAYALDSAVQDSRVQVVLFVGVLALLLAAAGPAYAAVTRLAPAALYDGGAPGAANPPSATAAAALDAVDV